MEPSSETMRQAQEVLYSYFSNPGFADIALRELASRGLLRQADAVEHADHPAVEGADGPERIFGEWWKRDAETRAVRDYFRIEDQAGRRFWIFRQGDGEDVTTGSHNWFLHGVFG